LRVLALNIGDALDDLFSVEFRFRFGGGLGSMVVNESESVGADTEAFEVGAWDGNVYVGVVSADMSDLAFSRFGSDSSIAISLSSAIVPKIIRWVLDILHIQLERR
jgi:hypothetical protein